MNSSRERVLGVLGLVTLGVAILSVAVSYQILEPKFGWWAVPTVAALDALWVTFQATEILAGNNRRRTQRVLVAGLALTLINAGIPTADLVMNRTHGFDLAVVLTPVAIVLTKLAWWIVLPALGRRTSSDTRAKIDAGRQKVADQLEQMEAEAAHRIEVLALAEDLERRIAEAETSYRTSVLRTRQQMTEQLHTQAVATQATVSEKALPASVRDIGLPVLGQWSPDVSALPGAAVLPALATGAAGSHADQSDSVATPGESGHAGQDAVMLADLAAVAGVPTPTPGVALTDAQLVVALRYLRYHDDPPLSYRQAVTAFRDAGFIGGEQRVRLAWRALRAQEEAPGADLAPEPEDEPEDEDAGTGA
ncbi:hypothetical protein ACFV0R_25730 [Streptomyces sp. NPDC059578]|uniref:hypothetical protein n=1 Tax=Streptomyces sp. NPDC059578 TaxID=3346874 RepID=UPI00369AA8A0